MLSSEFASLHRNAQYADTVQKAMSVMSYCARSDPQANRLVYILTTFNHVIVAKKPVGPCPEPEQPAPTTPTGSASNSSIDPMVNFFPSTPSAPPKAPNPMAPGPLPLTSHDSGSNNNNGQPSVGPAIHSPATVHTGAPTPAASSTAGDLMNDAEWFHFDTLWENWAPPLQPPGTSGAVAGAASSLAAITESTLFGVNPQSTLGGNGPAGPSSGFAGGPPDMLTQGAGDGRIHNAGAVGAMQVPMFPVMRFNE